MGTRINFSPLYGTHGDQALSYLLEIDKLTVLLDCGWTEDYDAQLLQPLTQVRAESGRFIELSLLHV